MTNITDETSGNFTRIRDDLINSDLSDSAFRLMCFIHSRPRGWEVNNNEIKFHLSYGDSKLARLWKELISKKYVVRHKTNTNGSFSYHYYYHSYFNKFDRFEKGE